MMKGNPVSGQLYVDIVGKPLDSRNVVATIQERDEIPGGYRYKGMIVFVQATRQYYKFDYVGDETQSSRANNSHWIPISMHEHGNLGALALIGTNQLGQFLWNGSPIASGGSGGGSGTVGPQGPQGASGVAGIAGIVGPQGNQGPAGSGGTGGGTVGPQGNQGPAGAIGPQGPQGSVGIAGSQGAQGAQGATGYQGTAGAAGTSNVPGPQGSAGTQGPAGTGSQGPQGPAGVGTQGATGAQGPQGVAGTGGGSTAPGVVVSEYTNASGRKSFVKATGAVTIDMSVANKCILTKAADVILISASICWSAGELTATSATIDFDSTGVSDYLTMLPPICAVFNDVTSAVSWKSSGAGFTLNVNSHTVVVSGLAAGTPYAIRLAF